MGAEGLYGMLRSALLFYNKLQQDLETKDFIINLYDPCIANKMINGHQMTVVWHVDDLKISHKHPWEVTKMILWLSQIYMGTLKSSKEKI